MERAIAKPRFTTSNMVKISILGVLSFIIMNFSFPLPLTPAFLKLDLSDMPSIIGGFAMGPVAGITIQLIKNILHFITRTSTGGIGEISNFIVGGSFVLISSGIYHINKTKKNAVIGSIAATIGMAIVGALSNYFIIIPFYSKLMPIDVIISMGTAVNALITDKLTLVLYGVIPFNLIKGIILSLATASIYKKVAPLLKSR